MAKVRISISKDYQEQFRMFMTLSNSARRKLRASFKKFALIAEKEYFELSDIDDKFYDDFFEEINDILRINAERTIRMSFDRLQRSRLKKEETDVNNIIQSYIASHTAINVVRISQTVRAAIILAIAKGIANGLSTFEISKNIRKMPIFAAYRATLIARTETHSAMNYGHQKTAEALGLSKPMKRWTSALDSRTRDWHRATNGQTVGLKEQFEIYTPMKGGAVEPRYLDYAGDMNGGAANTINCRCFVLYHDEGDILEP